MLVNHDLYRTGSDLIYFSKYATFEYREDEPIVFTPITSEDGSNSFIQLDNDPVTTSSNIKNQPIIK